MQQAARKLLEIQIKITAIFTVLAFFVAGISWQAVLAGPAVSCMASLVNIVIVRKLPPVLGGRDFYRMMLVCEMCKWLSVGLFTSILLVGTDLQALGIVIGFAVNYLGSHLVTFLLMK